MTKTQLYENALRYIAEQGNEHAAFILKIANANGNTNDNKNVVELLQEAIDGCTGAIVNNDDGYVENCIRGAQRGIVNALGLLI